MRGRRKFEGGCLGAGEDATAIGRKLLLELTEMKAREDAWPTPEEDE